MDIFIEIAKKAWQLLCRKAKGDTRPDCFECKHGKLIPHKKERIFIEVPIPPEEWLLHDQHVFEKRIPTNQHLHVYECDTCEYSVGEADYNRLRKMR